MGALDDGYAAPRRAGLLAGGSRPLLDTLRRRALIIVVTTLLVSGAAEAFAYLGPRKYQSTAQLLFSQTIGDELNALGLIPPTPNADKLAGDDQAIVASQRVAVLAAQQLPDHPSVRSVQSAISVPVPKSSDVVDVVATAGSPRRAAQLANAYAAAAIQIAGADQSKRTQALVANLQTQLQRLAPKDPAAVGVRARIVQVAALGRSGNGVPQLIQPGYTPNHRTGNPLSTVLLGVLFGLILGVALALVREQSDRRLRHPTDVSQAFEAPVLATVPRDNDLLRRLAPADLHPRLAEPFQMLHANLRYGHPEPVRSVVITSSRAKQGKTTVAWNLALAAASAGQSVILVDADLRRSQLAARYDLLPFPGLGEVVRGLTSRASAIQTVPVSPEGAPGNGHGPRLSVLVAGASPPDPSAVLQSPAMADLLAALRREYDLVIVDTPPVAQVADAIALLRQVDGVVVVASINSTEGSEAERLRGQLQALDARVLGAVANGGSRASGYVHVGSQRLSVG